jgi:hypothetical protein
MFGFMISFSPLRLQLRPPFFLELLFMLTILMNYDLLSPFGHSVESDDIMNAWVVVFLQFDLLFLRHGYGSCLLLGREFCIS